MIMQNGTELSRLKLRPAAYPGPLLTRPPQKHQHRHHPRTDEPHTPGTKPSNSPASTPKDEVNSPHQTKSCRGKIPSQLLFPEKDVESCKGDEGDDFLDDFELR